MADEQPFTWTDGGYALRLPPEERALLSRLLDELRALVADPEGGEALRRLFPTVHPEHPEREAEYQRLMREELVTSRLAGIDVVQEVLARPGRRRVQLDEVEMSALLQAINSVRLVLGTMLDVSEDDDVERPEIATSPEYHLYAFLSWLLDSAVRVMSGELDGP
ncbi:MAG: DUF2017 family protein [Ilumatobacteraceae bacterium]